MNALWIYSNEDANDYLDYLNTVDASGKIRLLFKLKMKMAFNI